MHTQNTNNEQEQNDTPSKKKMKMGWDKRLNLIVVGLVLAVGMKTILDIFFIGPLPPTEYPGMGGNFQLESVDGPVTMDTYKDKVVIVFFGYTHCPDICPAGLSTMAAALRKIKEIGDIEKVRALFITLDPARDSLEHMSDFTSYIDSRIIPLSGTEQQIAHAADLFKLGFQIDPKSDPSSEGYSVSHSSYLFIVRPDGAVGNLLRHNESPKAVVKAVIPWLRWAKES